MSSSIFWKLHFLDPPSHIQQHKQIDIMFRITNSTLMDRKYPNALAYIKIEAMIRVKQKLWAVKIWAKMIWKQPSSLWNIIIIISWNINIMKYATPLLLYYEILLLLNNNEICHANIHLYMYL